MAGIASSIELYDRVSAPINKIIGALNNMIGAFQSVGSTTDSVFDPSRFSGARQQIDLAGQQMSELAEEIEKSKKKQQDYNNEVEKGTSKVNSLASSVAKMIGAYVGFNAVKSTLSEAISYASDLQEVQNVVNVTFGSSAGEVNKWAKTTLEAYGLSELSAKKFAGTMGAMLRSSGVSSDAVMDMSMRIAELSGDMASFYNLGNEEAFNKIRAGISGETEPLKQLGINMSVASLEAYALSQGIKESYNEMSQGEQVMLRYNYLLQATKAAEDDFSNTSDSFANQQKLLSENWKGFIGGLAQGVLPILSTAISMLNGAVQFLSKNWSIVKPILIGIAAALAIANAGLIKQAALWVWNSVLVPAYNAIVGFLSLGYGVLTGSTAAASAAQLMYNNALLACPLTWILLIIIAVIAAVYAVIAVINKVTGKTISATGVIVGTLAVALAFVWNLFIGIVDAIIQFLWSSFVEPFIGIIEWILNVCGGGFDSFGGAVANLIGNIISWFLNLGMVVTKIIDAIFGTNWTSGLNALKNQVLGWGKSDTSITLSREAPTLESLGVERWDYGDAWNSGYDLGGKIEHAVGSAFDMDGLLADCESIAENTGKSADKLGITAEELKYMKDLAETEAINRFTTAEIKVEMTNNNNINGDLDLDGVVDYLTNGVNEAMEKAAEGVYV